MDSAEQIKQVRLLENGKGLQYLIDEAYRILGNPLVLFNMAYELMCCSRQVVTDDWLWNEIVETGVFSEASIRFFLEECFIDIVASTKSVSFLASHRLKYDRLYGRVYNKYRSTVADLILLGCDKPFDAHDAIVFEAVCEKLSHEISHHGFFDRYGILYEEKLICELLDAVITDKVVYSGHVSNLYEWLKTNLYVVVAAVGENNAVGHDLETLRDLCKEMRPEFKYAVYANDIVIITSTDSAMLDYDKDLYPLSRYFNDRHIRVGISRGFDNLYNLRTYYREAVDSLRKPGLPVEAVAQ